LLNNLRLDALSNEVAELAKRVQSVEQQRDQVNSVNKSSHPDFSTVKASLANFHNSCAVEHDRAAAMALAQNAPVLTYIGGAAMNCTEKLKTILDGLVDTLER